MHKSKIMIELSPKALSRGIVESNEQRVEKVVLLQMKMPIALEQTQMKMMLTNLPNSLVEKSIKKRKKDSLRVKFSSLKLSSIILLVVRSTTDLVKNSEDLSLSEELFNGTNVHTQVLSCSQSIY